MDKTQVLQVGDIIYRQVNAEIRRSSDDKKTIVVINPAGVVDDWGTMFDTDGIDVARYMKNPVVLVNHNWNLLAGVSSLSKRNGQLVGEILDSDWDLDDPEIARWFRKVKKGILRGVSMGCRIIDLVQETAGDKSFYRVTKSELYEWSFVTLQSNIESLVQQRQAALELQGLKDQIEQLTKLVAEQRQTSPAQAPSVEAQEDATNHPAVEETAPPQEQAAQTEETTVEPVNQTATPVVESAAEPQVETRSPETAPEQTPAPAAKTQRDATDEEYQRAAEALANKLETIINQKLGKE